MLYGRWSLYRPQRHRYQLLFDEKEGDTHWTRETVHDKRHRSPQRLHHDKHARQPGKWQWANACHSQQGLLVCNQLRGPWQQDLPGHSWRNEEGTLPQSQGTHSVYDKQVLHHPRWGPLQDRQEFHHESGIAQLVRHLCAKALPHLLHHTYIHLDSPQLAPSPKLWNQPDGIRKPMWITTEFKQYYLLCPWSISFFAYEVLLLSPTQYYFFFLLPFWLSQMTKRILHHLRWAPLLFYSSAFNSLYKSTGPKCQYFVLSVDNFLYNSER